jgi:MoaE-MoaD fusion protein
MGASLDTLFVFRTRGSVPPERPLTRATPACRIRAWNFPETRGVWDQSVTMIGVRVRVLFFGQLKDIVGRREDTLDLTDSASLGDVFARYSERFPRLAELRGSIVLARNQQFADASAAVADGDEIAFLPPVSGGLGKYTHLVEEGPIFVALTREPIDTRELASKLLRGEDGAIVDFEGVVRNNTKGRATRFLDYECYEAMAIGTMAPLAREIAAAHAIGRIGMVHRLGRMEIGDTSVAVIAAAPHRRPAFEAALEGINRLKKTVPIWKKEYFEDGEVWVEGEWDESIPSA